MGRWLTGIAIGFAIGVGAALVAIYYGADSLSASTQVARPAKTGETRRGQRAASLASSETAAWTLGSEDLLHEIMRLPSDFDQTLTLYALLQDADSDDLERLLDNASSLRPAREGRAVAGIVYSRYAELAPDAAVNRILARGRFDRQFLRSVFAIWAQHDVDAALARADELPLVLRQRAGAGILSKSEQLSARRKEEIADRFALQGQLDMMNVIEMLNEPEAAWQHALASENDKRKLLAEVGLAWVEHHPEQAMNAAAALPDSDTQRLLNQLLMSRWASADSDAALQWALARPRTQARLSVLQGIATGLAEHGMDVALNFALELEGGERREVANVVFQLWAYRNSAAATAALDALEDDALFAAASAGIMRHWAQQNPRAAFEWFTNRQTGTNYRPVLPALQAVAQADPETALDMAFELSGDARRLGVAEVLDVWAQDDPRAAASWLEDAAAGDRNYRQLAIMVSSELAMEDPEAAFRWAQQQPVELQTPAMSGLIARVAENSLQDAADLAARIRDANVRAAAANELAWHWAHANPQQALRWIARRVEQRERPTLRSRVFTIWVRNDRDTAIAAMRRLERSDRDTVATSLVRNLVHDAPDVAELVYKGISKDPHRQEAAEILFWHWFEDDPDRARQYQQAGDSGEAAPPIREYICPL